MMDETSTGCRLPPELVQHILKYLSNDNESEEWNKKSSSLLSVCLASHTMCQMAAPHLYRTVILNDPRRAQTFFSLFSSQPSSTQALWNNNKSIVRLHMKHLWCGIMRELLYDSPHKLLHEVQTSAQEVAWMQADSDGRYHGFHYSAEQDSQSIDKPFCINAIHIVCPDLGRWTLPLFFHLESVKFVAVSLYPKGNWDLEAAKIENVLRGILSSCRELEALEIIVCHTRAAAGSRAIRMNRSVPVAHAVRAIDDDRITVKAADYLFDVYGRSPADEVVQYTRIHWQDRVQGGFGPWAAMAR